MSRLIDEATSHELIRERRREMRSRIEVLKAAKAKAATALTLARRDAIQVKLIHADAAIALADAMRKLLTIK